MLTVALKEKTIPENISGKKFPKVYRLVINKQILKNKSYDGNYKCQKLFKIYKVLSSVN